MEIHSLTLLAPLYYYPEEGTDPFGLARQTEEGERLFCFEINEEERLSFEPDGKKLIGSLVFSGAYATVEHPGKRTVKALLELPRGNYLFAQRREILSREEVISMAVEIQLECLWHRHEPGNCLYLRYLFEDNRWVTQLFRPFS